MAINDYHTLFAEYGDKLMMSVPASDVPADADDETQREWAAKYVEEYAIRDKPVYISHYDRPGVEFTKEVYRLSRIKYCGE